MMGIIWLYLSNPRLGMLDFFGPFPPPRRPQRGPPPPPPACLSLCAPSLLLLLLLRRPPPFAFRSARGRRRRLFRGRRCSILSSLSLLALGAGRTKQKTHAAEEEEETPLTTKARAARRPTTTRPWSSKTRRGKSEDFAARGSSARKESVSPSPCVQLKWFFFWRGSLSRRGVEPASPWPWSTAPSSRTTSALPSSTLAPSSAP